MPLLITAASEYWIACLRRRWQRGVRWRPLDKINGRTRPV